MHTNTIKGYRRLSNADREEFRNPQWERGTNENTNGLVRQFFPKGTEFDKVSVREIKRVQLRLNDRPRVVLDYPKSNEVFSNLVSKNKKTRP